MGPRAGGFTCSLALVRLPSIISDTRSATPCENCAVSTPAATLNVGVGALSVEVLEVSSCAAPTLPSFDTPESVESGLLPCVRLSAAPVLAAAETTCAADAVAAAVIAADIAAAEACAKAAAGMPSAGATAAAPLTAAAPDGRSLSPADNSSAKAASGAGAFVPCAIAAAMAAWTAASVPAAAVGPLFEVESLVAPASAEDGAELTEAVVARFVAGSLGFAGTVAPVGDPGAASVRKLAACGMVGPDPAVASAPAVAGKSAEAGAAAGAGGPARLSAVKGVVMPLALAAAATAVDAVDAAAIALGAGPCTLPDEALATAAASAATAAEASAFAGGGGVTATGGGLPGAGNELPPALEPCCLLAAFLRTGLSPASLRAVAKSWLPGRLLADAAEAGASGWTASLEGCACNTGGAAFIPPEIASDVPTPSARQAPYFRYLSNHASVRCCASARCAGSRRP